MGALKLLPEDDDAAAFISEVEEYAEGIVQSCSPPQIIVIKIDNWFGPRWLHFSGKVLGALGVRHSTLTVPPFVPNRAVWERRFVAPSYDSVSFKKPIHLSIHSDQALTRRVSEVAPKASLVWYNGHSREAGRGALMAYVWRHTDYWSWYIGFAHTRKAWRMVKLVDIGQNEVSALRAHHISA